jgi:hypothetical protein
MPLLLGGATQTIRQNTHYLNSEQGGALNEGEEVLTSHGNQQTIGGGAGAGAAWAILDQRHFTQDIPGANSFNDLVTHLDIDLAFGHDIQSIARFALLENKLASGEGQMFFGSVKKFLR